MSIPPNNGNEKEPENAGKPFFLALLPKNTVTQSSSSKGGDFRCLAN
jgi:hypothetical protein